MKAVDCLGFAGSFACGVDQAGFDVIAKREPTKFKGFGVGSMTYNMPWVEAQVAAPEDWDLPEEPVDLVFGCPPCSGFSQLSYTNTVIHGATVGPDAPINECMGWLIDYAARVKPRVVILESVGVAFNTGRDWMESLWQRLRDRSGLPYDLTHVNMNAAMVGGDTIRPRYFLVAHLDPFGVGLEFVEPRSINELIADLPEEEEDDDLDWGHRTLRIRWTRKLEWTMDWLKKQGFEWKEGTMLPENTGWVIKDGKPLGFSDGRPPLEIPHEWHKERPAKSKRAGFADDVMAAWFSTDSFTTRRWRGAKPSRVWVGAALGRTIHPRFDRCFTFREAARFMSLPDDWSLRWLVERRGNDAELGKAVPAASGKWISHWALKAIEGQPGEYAGVSDKPGVRVITVNTPSAVAAARRHSGAFWTGSVADPDPVTWLIDRKQRPETWWQRDDTLGLFKPARPAHYEAPPAVRRPQPRTRRTQTPASTAGASRVVRVEPERVQALLDEVGLTKAQAAEKLGVSVSRVNELVTHTRPKSWLNAERWADVQQALRS